MRKGLLVLPLLVPFIAGCSGMGELDQAAKARFFAGDFSGAAMSLDPIDPQAQGKDRLLFCMERGVILHTAGRYAESNNYLNEAKELSLEMQPIRTGAEVESFLLNENAKEYKGEDYERILIHAYLAMNCALMGQLENAQAACRGLDAEMQRINDIRQKDFAQAAPGSSPDAQQMQAKHAALWQQRMAEYAHLNSFATYLSGILYEAQGDLGNALIFYERALAQEPHFLYLPEDILRTSRLAYPDKYQQWKRQFGREGSAIDWKQSGEIIVLFQNGLAPVKVPAPDFPYVPACALRPGGTQFGNVFVNGRQCDRTYALDNIEAQSIITLQEQDAAVRIKRLAALIVKHGVAEAVRQQNEAAGVLLHIFAEASEQPDLRCWKTLPKELQIARVPLPPGTYSLEVQCVGGNQAMRVDNIVVKPGGHVFVNLRTVN